MSLFLGHIVTLLTTPPGNLIYHIVLVFSIAGALQGAIQSAHFSHFPQERRTVIGLSVMLGMQLVLFIISGLTWRELLNAQSVLPPLDRAVTLLMLVWIAWLWAFPEPARLGDAATLLLNLLIVVVLALTLFFWIQNPTKSFNLSAYETGWQILSVGIVLLGTLGLVLRRPNGWSYGLAMLLLAFCGHFVSLVYPIDGNFPGLVRLAQLGMFPILLTLSQRFSSPTRLSTPAGKSGKALEPVQERRRYSTDPKTFHALMSLAAETDPGKIGQTLTRGIAQAMLADLCFLITRGKDKSLAIICGYSLIREENIAGMRIDQDSVPLLANAIQHGRPLRLPASSTSSDLKSLGQILGLGNPGNLLNVPVSSTERGVLGSILILSPYSNRLWRAEDQSFLSNVSSLFIPILERGQRVAAMQGEHDKSVKQANIAVEQAAEARKKFEQMVSELEGQVGKVPQAKLQAGNTATGTPGPAGDPMERELNQTLEEMAKIQKALANANARLQELENRPAAPIDAEQAKVVSSISQELRQPVSSVTSYTDLLMGESVGILGALQREFIERIKVSTEKIGGLVDDLVQATNLESGKKGFKPEPIDLNLIIDNAMAHTSTQIRAKNITLRLDITGNAPHLRTDRNALQQILICLLQNATAATQKEGNIYLRVQVQAKEDNHFLSIQVTDNGGGIASGDIPRLFSSRSEAGHALIKGLGDTGDGLSIVKSLVEAQNGRIWVDTEEGVGSTFNVLMPVAVEPPVKN
jgi:signal transduction histidine kinase